MIELLVVISIITLLVSLVLPSLTSARRVAKQQICASVLRNVGVAGNSYVADHRDRLFSFSWKFGISNTYNSTYADIQTASQNWQNDLDAQGGQLTHLLRETLQDDDQMHIPSVYGAGFFPYRYYSLLPLRDYLGGSAPSKAFVCPSDGERLRWIDADYFESRKASIAQEVGDTVSSSGRWRASSSFMAVPASFQPDVGRDCMVQSTPPGWGFLAPPMRLGGRRMADVAFPSSKVWVMDWHDRHSNAKMSFYAESFARQPLLLFDGSVSLLLTRNIHRGASPYFRNLIDANGNAPALFIRYPQPKPAIGELSIPTQELGLYNVSFLYTQGGLKGADFGATPVDTRHLP